MTKLAQRNTFFGDLFDFRRDFDELFNRLLPARPWDQEASSADGGVRFVPALESYMDPEQKRFVGKVALPGVDPKDVRVEVEGDTLTISGERKAARESKQAEYLTSEMVYGAFARTLTLPQGVDSSKLTAEHRDGLLEISAPVSGASLPRRIEIKGAPPERQLAA